MPVFKTPGIFVEELTAACAIAAVPTDVALFVGSTLTGPASGEDPFPPIDSPADFAQIYAGNAVPDPTAPPDFLAAAVHAFFANGGVRLHIARTATADEAGYRDALAQSADLADVGIVAAPGASALADPLAIAQALIAHVDAPGSRRFAIIDPQRALDAVAITAVAAQIDSANAAIYYPWVMAADADGTIVALPPSGFVAGIYARVDRARGVFKPPANEIVQSAIKLAASIGQDAQAQLNPLGINCIRSFVGRGILVWGARTLSTNSEAKYINVRRLLRMIEASLRKGMNWAVFEPNGEPAWARVRLQATRFLTDQWRAGALLGSKPEQAFFVRCDRTTMTADDLANGRLVCEIGVAVLKPAEFVIFRIVSKTANSG